MCEHKDATNTLFYGLDREEVSTSSRILHFGAEHRNTDVLIERAEKRIDPIEDGKRGRRMQRCPTERLLKGLSSKSSSPLELLFAENDALPLNAANRRLS